MCLLVGTTDHLTNTISTAKCGPVCDHAVKYQTTQNRLQIVLEQVWIPNSLDPSIGRDSLTWLIHFLVFYGLGSERIHKEISEDCQRLTLSLAIYFFLAT